jgi:hypothetical protein
MAGKWPPRSNCSHELSEKYLSTSSRGGFGNGTRSPPKMLTAVGVLGGSSKGKRSLGVRRYAQ